MIYLASPYTHVDAAVRKWRFDAACMATATLMRAGLHVFSPILHSHPLVRFGLPVDWAFWQTHDCEHLRRCDELMVLILFGWNVSRGVQAEIGMATELGLPIQYLSLRTILTLQSIQAT